MLKLTKTIVIIIICCCFFVKSYNTIIVILATSIYWQRKSQDLSLGRTTSTLQVSWKSSPNESSCPDQDSNRHGEGLLRRLKQTTITTWPNGHEHCYQERKLLTRSITKNRQEVTLEKKDDGRYASYNFTVVNTSKNNSLVESHMSHYGIYIMGLASHIAL